MLSEWTEFSDCDNQCGVGSETRTRSCIINEVDCIPTELSGSCGDVILSESQCCVGANDCGKQCFNQIFISNCLEMLKNILPLFSVESNMLCGADEMYISSLTDDFFTLELIRGITNVKIKRFSLPLDYF